MTESGPGPSEAPQTTTAGLPEGAPWGLWGTVGLSLGVMFAFVFIQGIFAGFFSGSILAEQPDIAQADLNRQLEGNGSLLTVATWTTGILCTSLILLLARMRRGISVRDYLALSVPSSRTLAIWVGVGIAVVIAGEGLLLLAREDTVPEFMISAYQSAAYLPLFWIALVVWGPLFEEFLFRGFLFRGLLNSRLRANGAILLTAALFTALHLQYDAIELLVVFAVGLVLGLSRHRTGSLIPPLAIHSTMNLAATAQVALLV